MIDKDLLRRQLKEAQERRSAGNIAYVKGDVSLRVIPFKDGDSMNFARKFVQWRPRGEGRPVAHRGNWDKPDLFESVKRETPDFPWRETSAYLVNAIDVSGNERELRVWQLPVSVYEAIAEILLDDDYDHALDPKSGVPFKIKRTGTGLATKYSVMVGQKAVDVSKFVSAARDPMDAVSDPGLETQASALGVDLGDFDIEADEPAPVAEKKIKKPAPVAEDDDEDEDEDELFPAPAKKSSTGKAPSIRDLLKGGKK